MGAGFGVLTALGVQVDVEGKVGALHLLLPPLLLGALRGLLGALSPPGE